MGIILRQSIKTVGVTYTGIALGFFNTLVLYPLVLTEEQIGLTRTLTNAALLFATFAALGSATIPPLFFPYFKDKSKEHDGFLFFILSVGALGFFLFGVMFFFFQTSVVQTFVKSAPLIVEYLHYLLPLTFAILFYNILEIYTVVQQLPVVPSIIREVFIRGMIAVGMLLILFHIFSFNLFVPWVVGTYFFALVVIVVYLKRNDILFLRPNISFIESKQFKPMIAFGGFALLANISGVLITNIDGIMLSAYSGLKSTGIYAIAFFIAQVVEIPKRSLAQVLIPLISEANKNNDMIILKKLYKKSSINQLIVGGIIFLFIWCNIDNIFQFIPRGEIYVAGKWVVFYIGLGKLFDLGTGINAEIIGTSKYYKTEIIFYVILSIIGIGTNLVFIPVYGLTGAAIAQAISVLLFNIMRSLFVFKIYRMQPFTYSTIIVLLLGLVVLYLNSFIPWGINPYLNILLRSILILSVFVGGAILFKTSEDINGVVKKVTSRFKINFRL